MGKMNLFVIFPEISFKIFKTFFGKPVEIFDFDNAKENNFWIIFEARIDRGVCDVFSLIKPREAESQKPL